MVLFLFFISFFSNLNSTTPLKLLESVKVIHINSTHQRMVQKKTAVFEGDVEVLLDRSLHVWADKIKVDDEKKTLVARRVGTGQVTIEGDKFLIFADTFTLNLDDQTGSADNIKIHVFESYFSAKKAVRTGKYSWHLYDAWYTPCDAELTHWQIDAAEISLQGGYFACLSNVIFKIGSLPVFWLPRFIIPLQRQSSSGFLLPKLYFDYNDGFGAKISYYHRFAERCDTTFSIDLRNKKGMVFSDEFRWARSPESFSFFDVYYAISRNTFILRQGSVTPATRHRYSLAGKDFQSLGKLFGADVRSLLKIDFGTDKRIGYQFFNNLDQLDDLFNNAWIIRGAYAQDLLELKLDICDIERKRFSLLSNEEKLLLEQCNQVLRNDGEREQLIVSTQKELEHHVSSFYLPQFLWSHSRHYGSYCSYNHDFVFDHVYHREHALERLFSHRLVGQEDKIIPLNEAQLFRLNYKGIFDFHYQRNGHVINAFIVPYVQGRSLIEKDCWLHKNVCEKQLFSRGAARVFATGGIGWTLPTVGVQSYDESYTAFLQSALSWNYTPYFQQDHWFHIDRWDRIFPRNEISLSLQAYGSMHNVMWSCDLTIPYECGKQSLIMPLRRGLTDAHLLPLEWSFNLDLDCFSLSLTQEYDLRNTSLVSSDVMVMLTLKNFRFGCGYLFHHHRALERRELLSTIQHFGLFDVSLPFTRHLTMHYDSQLYAEKGTKFLGFKSIKPLLHRIRLEYSGHCWGMYIGYEEKKYRDFGVDKTERALVFSLSLDSIGSFAKKFSKSPEVITS